MMPERAYSVSSKIYVNKPASSKFWLFVKAVLIVYLAVALFKTIMEGRLDVAGTFGNVIVPLLLLGVAFRSRRTVGEYQPVSLTLRLFDGFMQAVFGPWEGGKGKGGISEMYEISYSDIQLMEYSIPLVCLRIVGVFRFCAHQGNADAGKELQVQTRESDKDLFLYLESEKADEILAELSRFSGKGIARLQ